jgi:hypothetical protein
VVRTRCNDEDLYIGTLHVAGLSLGTAVWSIGSLPGPVAAGEYYNDKPNLVMDFRVNMKEICPIEDSTLLRSTRHFLPFKNSLPPVNSFVDIARIVGRDPEDGGLIFLSKAMASDPVLGYVSVPGRIDFLCHQICNCFVLYCKELRSSSQP